MIQHDDVRHIAKLARLQLEESEIATYTEQLGRILAFFDQLQALDTTGVPVTAHPMPISNAFREDVARPSLPLEKALAAAQATEGDCFRVPKILEG